MGPRWVPDEVAMEEVSGTPRVFESIIFPDSCNTTNVFLAAASFGRYLIAV